jgi:hypothetical protein
MYGVPANTPIKVLAPKAEWFANNFRDHVTTKFNVFDTHEVIVDPSGVHKHASVPGPVTVGSLWAQHGWFGFRDQDTGWVMMVQPQHLEYDGQPLCEA